ncbi:hypothetical protein LTR51_008616 [Lithohypha guttulata]|nr:hypothetical protein LTR51_008616 [Lithohypha guttulata]
MRSNRIHVSLDLNIDRVHEGIRSYVDEQLRGLAYRHDYDIVTQSAITRAICDRANGTFLWVSFVCSCLEGVSAEEALSVVTTAPPDLVGWYGQAFTSMYAGHEAIGRRDIFSCSHALRLSEPFKAIPSLTSSPDGVQAPCRTSRSPTYTLKDMPVDTSVSFDAMPSSLAEEYGL